MENLENWRKAGKITAETLDYARKLIKKDVLLLEIAEKVEEKVKSLGGEMAFPVNISLNHIAAHYTPSVNDDKRFWEDLVKLDVGAHVEGCIGDSAITVDLSGKWTDLINAARDAVNNAIKIVRPGITLGEIGQTIQETINSYEYVPIRNLSGHEMEPYLLHAGQTIPNIAIDDDEELEEGQVIAIEPFATTGQGKVEDSSNPEIFSIQDVKPVRSQAGREFMKKAMLYETLPFCKRWIQMPLFKLNFAVKELVNAGNLHEYPPLIEAGKGMVAQAEHTVLVQDKPEVLTKL